MKKLKIYLFILVLLIPLFPLETVHANALAMYGPSAILTQTNTTGNVSVLQEDVDTPDANYLTVVDGTLPSALEVALTDPPVLLKAGAGLQTIRVLVKKNNTGGNNPTASLLLYDNNGTRTQIGTTQTITLTDTPTILSISFDANSLVDKTGKNLEVRITGTPAGGGAATKRTVLTGAINFDATLNIAPFGPPPNFRTSTISQNTVSLSWDSVFGATSYEVFRDGVSVYNGSGTTFTDTGLIKNTSYSYEIKAFNGTSTTAPSSLTVRTLLDKWKEISSNDDFSVAIKSDGTLWTWGKNDNGELGLGDTAMRNFPTQVGVDTDWKSISAGVNHSLATKTDGTLWVWGYNNSKQLGLGDSTSRYIPTKVGTATDWKFISAGNFHSSAIKTDGSLWMWGSNFYGQLGLGDTTERTIPTKVGTATDWNVISLGNSHSASLKTDGTLWTWGRNNDGQLGFGDTTQRTSPTKVGTATDWKNISTVSEHSLAIKTDGTLWAWGDNDYNQLGFGDANSRYVPTKVGTDVNWNIVSTDTYFTLATKTDGTLWSWGSNYDGQLGQGDNVNRNITKIGIDTDWNKIEVGSRFSMATKTDGTLWTWGDNNSSQLGFGDTTDRLVPTRITSEPKTSPLNFRYTTISPTSVQLDWDAVTSATTYIVKRNGSIVFTGSPNTFSDSGIATPDLYQYEVYGVNSDGVGPSSTLNVPIGLQKQVITLNPNLTSSMITDDFESATRPFNYIGSWIRTNEVAKNGTFSFRSSMPTIAGMSETTLSVIGPTTVSFWYKVVNVDYNFNFYINNNLMVNELNVVDWTYVEYSLGSGTHTLKWENMGNNPFATQKYEVYIDDLKIDSSTPSPVTVPLNAGKYYYAEAVDDLSSVPFRLSTDGGTNWGTQTNGLSVFNTLIKGQSYSNLKLEHRSPTVKTFNYYYLPNVDTTPPSNISSFNDADPTSTSIKMSWTRPSDSDLNHIKIYRDGVFIGTTGTETFTDTGLSPYTNYEYRFVSVDDAGNESSGIIQNYTTTHSESYLEIRSSSAMNQVTLEFQNNEPSSQGFEGTYRIYRDGVLVKTSDYYTDSETDGFVTFVDNGLNSSTTYSYRITVEDFMGYPLLHNTHSVSTTDVTPPSEVTNLILTPSINSINLTWTNPVDADFAKIKIYRNGIFITETTGTSYTNTGLTPSTLYTYKVTTVDNKGNESNGIIRNISTNSDSLISDNGYFTVDVTEGLNSMDFVLFSDTIADVKYEIIRNGSTVGEGFGDEFETVLFTDSPLTSNTTYSYDIIMYDYTDMMFPLMIDSITFNATTTSDVTPPTEVTSLGETHTETTIDLSWVNPSDSDFDHTNIYRNGVLIGNSTNGIYNDSSLTAGTTYTYKVTTVDDNGNESTGVTIIVTTNSTGSLSIMAPSSDVNMGLVTTNGNIQTLSSSLDALIVSDTRSVNDGWHITVESTPFTQTNYEIGNTPKTLPINTFKLNGISNITQTSGSSVSPTVQSVFPSILDNGPIEILSANIGEGVGTFEINFPLNALSLEINTSDALVDALNTPTNYESTITWTVTSGP